ncbi:hypothetical protein MCHI_000403 [Candidatus Magnetoovum chiemensis]|nr:hypothetical protein MCHI_000403 [Candidatus Magnetoovum chiemensis]
MSGSINVELSDKIIIATYKGEMTIELVKKAQDEIEKYLNDGSADRILYNTIEMLSPAMKLAIDMQNFDAKIRQRVVRSATVVPGAGTAFKASIAFAKSKNHRVFHNDYESAVIWLKSD